MATFPVDKQLPNTDDVIRQTDCQYQFGRDGVTLTLKFMGDTTKVVDLTSSYRQGILVPLSTITGDFTELTGTNLTNLDAKGKVVSSVSQTKTGCASATIVIQIPYASKIVLGKNQPNKRIIVTWAEKSTNYEKPIEIYAGDNASSATDANAGDLDAWKNMKTKDIALYKEFKYFVDGMEDPVELTGRTLELAQKIYRGVEAVSRAYPEVIRTTQYINLKGDEDEVDKRPIKAIKEKPKLYYRDQTPDAVWSSKFKGFDWLKAGYDVQVEATEYEGYWNATVTESWLGCDPNQEGTWDDDLYGPDGTRWKFAGVNGVQPSGSYDDDTPIEPEDVSGKGRVKPDTFQNQSDIKTIDLGGDFHAVDKDAFRAASTRGLRLLAATATPGAPALESITMPSVSFIGDDAFNGAANLQSIALPNRISFLGERVFKDCSAMTEAIVEPSIYELPASTFEGCSALDGSQGGTFTVGGLVNSLGEYAFKDCTALTAINCTNALTSIGANAFENDDALTSFTMGLNSTGSITIGNEAFKGCSALADIELPVPTITLGTDSFLNAFASEVTVKAPKSFLTNLPNTSSYNYIYPAFVDTIASGEWQNDTKLLSAVVCDAITSIPENAFRGCSNCTSVTLPDTITGITHDAFRQSGITSFVVPPLMTGTLAYNMFYQCTALESVDFNNVTLLGADIFSGCTSLTQLFNEDKLTSIQARAFSDCALVTFDAGSGLTSIGANAFRRNAALKSFKIPENETGSLTIGATAFDSCTALERIEIPVGGTLTIGTTIFNNALANEIWLKAPFNADLIASIPSGKLVNYIYPSFTTSIAANEWQNNTKLKSIEVTEAITSLGNNMCNGCTSLERAVFKPSVTNSGTSTFGLCSALTDLEIGGNTLTTLGLNFAKNCTSLVNLTITAPLTTLTNSGGAWSGVFRGCSALTSISLPDTLTTIGGLAFYGCWSLTELTIPSSVTSIGANALNIGGTSNPPEVTMVGKDMATVQAMTDYPWGLRTGSTVHCSDGDITI